MENQPQKKWYKDTGYRKADEYNKVAKTTEWLGLIIVIAVGIYAFIVLYQLSK